MDKLLPCPFCGNEDIKIKYDFGNHNIECTRCCVEMIICGEPCGTDRQDAIDQWNRRVTKALLSKEEIAEILSLKLSQMCIPDDNHERADILVDAILKAQQNKQEE